MGTKKAAALSSAIGHRLARIEEMTTTASGSHVGQVDDEIEIEPQRSTAEKMPTDQISKLMWDSWDEFHAGKLTALESGVLTKAAHKRLRAIRKVRFTH